VRPLVKPGVQADGVHTREGNLAVFIRGDAIAGRDNIEMHHRELLCQAVIQIGVPIVLVT
jgi:hypothetical protein